MVESDSQLAASTLDIYKVFEPIDMLSMGISLKQLYPHYLGQILLFWVICGVNMMV